MAGWWSWRARLPGGLGPRRCYVKDAVLVFGNAVVGTAVLHAARQRQESTSVDLILELAFVIGHEVRVVNGIGDEKVIQRMIRHRVTCFDSRTRDHGERARGVAADRPVVVIEIPRTADRHVLNDLILVRNKIVRDHGAVPSRT